MLSYRYRLIVVALKDINKGETIEVDSKKITLKEDVKRGHKIAIEDIKEGSGRYDFFVQGINKESKNYSGDQGQAFDERVLLGKVQFGSTFLGIVYKGVTSVWGLLILILLPSGYLIITSILDIVKGLKEDDEDTKQKVESTDGLQLSNEDKERLKSELL